MASIGDNVDFNAPRLEGYYPPQTEAQQQGDFNPETVRQHPSPSLLTVPSPYSDHRARAYAQEVKLFYAKDVRNTILMCAHPPAFTPIASPAGR